MLAIEFVDLSMLPLPTIDWQAGMAHCLLNSSSKQTSAKSPEASASGKRQRWRNVSDDAV
jgi:hypothetical protein